MDLNAIFSRVLNMSLTGSLVILFVLWVRFLLRRAPKIYSYCLWAVVLFRLLCPVSISASVSVLELVKAPVTQTQGLASSVSYIPYEADYRTYSRQIEPVMGTEAAVVESPETVEAGETGSEGMLLSSVWICGMAVMVSCSAVMYLRLRWKLVGAIRWRGNIYIADHIDSPFVMGLAFPKIYLPSYLPRGERCYIVAHERHHIRRFDHIMKLLAYGALCIHWFNPLAWAAFMLAGKDMEMSCDEAVIRKLGPQIRADYSASLLRLATGCRIIAGTPLAFGEGDTKGRVLNMAKWKKPKLWVSMICLLLCAAVLVACAVNPVTEETGEPALMANAEGAPFQMGQLPDGYSYVFDESAEDAHQVISFSNGEAIVGGVNRYPIPEGVYDPDDEVFLWLEEAGIPDFEDTSLCYMGGVTASNGGWIAEFASDVPEGTEPAVDRRHYFYAVGAEVYDLWFDMLLLNMDTSEEIRKVTKLASAEAAATADGMASGELMPTIPAKDIVLDIELVTYGALNMVLPAGYASREENGAIVLTRNDQDFGGITCYSLPDFPLNKPENMSEWVDALSLPESKMDLGGPIASMIGDTTNGDLEAEIFFEQDPGLLNTEHHFYIDGNLVYDVYYNQNLISDTDAHGIMDTIALNAAPVMDSAYEEEAAFEKCLAVMDAVENGSYHIVSQQIHNGEGGLKGYERSYFWHEGDYLNITTIITEGENTTKAGSTACLSVNDSFFSGEGQPGESGEMRWTAEDPVDPDSPWLGHHAWDRRFVTYMDTLTDENRESIMFRYDKPYDQLECSVDYYFVSFDFDADGNFMNVYLQINPCQDNAVTITESMVSMDPETVNAQIQKQYQSTIG